MVLFFFQHGKIYIVLWNNETKSFVIQARSPKHKGVNASQAISKYGKCFPQFPNTTTPWKCQRGDHVIRKTSQIGREWWIECVEMGCTNGRTTRKAKSDTTLPATQDCLRTVKAGLGGHDAGVFWVDEGVETTSLPLQKRGRTAVSDCAAFSDFGGSVDENVS